MSPKGCIGQVGDFEVANGGRFALFQRKMLDNASVQDIEQPKRACGSSTAALSVGASAVSLSQT